MGNAAKINAVRGMNDVLPTDIGYWHYLEDTFRVLVETYGYQEIRTPLVENTGLFIRSIGAATDIVEKETYTFTDRNGDSLTLRPEYTASTVRAGIEHGLFYNQVQRLWYSGPLFRHERPQKGRYRQFHQMGLEAFGMAGPEIDAELLFLTWRLWQRLHLTKHVNLQINTLGTPEERLNYRAALVDYFTAHHAQLDEDSVRRLTTNPLRILDSKNPDLRDVIAKAPILLEYLGEESRQQFQQICSALDAANIPYEINPRLVRGLDYYCHLVFEWVSDDLGAQGTVCAGGRYDGLVAELGGDAVPAVGLAMGVERLVLLLQQEQQKNNYTAIPDVYLISVGTPAAQAALLLAEELRNHHPKLVVITDCSGSSFKSQLKKADKSGAYFAILLGENELATNTVTLKYLREVCEQKSVTSEELFRLINDKIGE